MGIWDCGSFGKKVGVTPNYLLNFLVNLGETLKVWCPVLSLKGIEG